MRCYCCSGLKFKDCCKPLHLGINASTPLALMRSRYSAFILLNFDYLEKTAINQKFDKTDIEWAKNVEWNRLEIINHKDDWVEFCAYYNTDGNLLLLHEKSTFVEIDEKWLYNKGIIYRD